MRMEYIARRPQNILAQKDKVTTYNYIYKHTYKLSPIGGSTDKFKSGEILILMASVIIY